MDFKEKAKAAAPDCLKDLDTLVRIESVRQDELATKEQPFGPGPAKALDAFLAMAERDGFTTKNIDGYAGVIEYGDPGNEDTIGILGHLDVVPLGQGWTKPPLELTEEDGYLFGRGVLDDKGPTMAAYYGLKLIKDAGIPLNKRILFIAGTDEERGMGCMDYYCEHAEVPKTGFVPDAEFPLIYGEKGTSFLALKSNVPTKIKRLKAGVASNVVIGKADLLMETATPEQKQLFQFYLDSHNLKGSVTDTEEGVLYHIDGTSSHGAMPWLGNNAAMHLLRFAGAAYHDAYAAKVGNAISDWTGSPLGILTDSPTYGLLTLNSGIMDITPEKQTVTLDIRFPDGIDVQTIREKIQAHFAQDGIRVEQKAWEDPLYVDPESDLVKTLMEVYKRNTGNLDARPFTIGGGTYAKKFKNFVSYGPERPDSPKTTDQFVGGCHQRDEGIKKEDFVDSIAIYADAIASLAAA